MPTRARAALLSLAFVPTCDDEHWFSYDDAQVAIEGPAIVTVRVTTTPEAYPEHLYDAAVRGAFRGAGRVRLAESDAHEPYRISRREMNVLDAWDPCDREEICVQDVRFEVVCDAECSGAFFVDAFLATRGLFFEGDGGEGLDVEIVDVTPTDPA